MSRKTGIVKDERYLRHDAGFGHPESPQRLEATHAILEAPDMAGQFVEIEPRYATHEEIGIDSFSFIHQSGGQYSRASHSFPSIPILQQHRNHMMLQN